MPVHRLAVLCLALSFAACGGGAVPDVASRGAAVTDSLVEPDLMASDPAPPHAIEVDPGEAPLGSDPNGLVSSDILDVDANFVTTPYGVMARAYVHEVPDDSEVADDGSVTTPDGRTLTFDAPSVLAQVPEPADDSDAGAGAKIFESGWIMYSYWSFPEGLRAEASTWSVPHAPAHVGHQSIGLFPGLEDNPSTRIVQPVLQWGKSLSGGGHYWAFSSWLYKDSTHVYFTHMHRTHPGNVIHGAVEGSDCNLQTKVCRTWTITTRDATSGKKPAVLRHKAPVKFTLAFPGVVEAYDIRHCSDYPSSDKTRFHDVKVWNVSRNRVAPVDSYFPVVEQKACKKGVLAAPTWTDLVYRNASF